MSVGGSTFSVQPVDFWMRDIERLDSHLQMDSHLLRVAHRFQRWGAGRNGLNSRRDDSIAYELVPPLRGSSFNLCGFPQLKLWATVFRPFGTGPEQTTIL